MYTALLVFCDLVTHLNREKAVLLGLLISMLAAVVISDGTNECKHESSSPTADVFAKLTKMATELLSQTANNTAFVMSEDNIEMQFSGFTSTVRIKPDLGKVTEEKGGSKDTSLAPICSVPEKVSNTEVGLQKLGYQKYNGHYYKYHIQGANWWAAKLTCEKEGGHLVIINSDEEADTIARIFNSHPSPQTKYPAQMFIGLNDLAEEGNIVTVLGEPLNSTGYVWRKLNQSNSKGNNRYGENCFAFASFEIAGNDIHCEAKLSFMCEATVP